MINVRLAMFIRLMMVLLTLSVLAAAESPWESGDALCDRYRYEEAAKIYEKAANAGDLRSLARLAQLRLSGVGVPEDRVRGNLDMRKAADGGIPEAMESVANNLWMVSERSRKKLDEQQQIDQKIPAAPEAFQALSWKRRAAEAWITEGKPYKAWRIANDLPNVQGNSYDLISATKATYDAIRQAVEAVPNDRSRALTNLFSLPPNDEHAGELLTPILLPPNPPIISSYDIKTLRMVRTLGRPGHHGVVLLTRTGQRGVCGTGLKSGGITAPNLAPDQTIDFALGFAADGTLSFNHRVGRENMHLIDADGDNIAMELIVYSSYFDYSRPPFLKIYDLRAPGVPLMLSLTFNADRDPSRYPQFNNDGDIPILIVPEKPRTGSWNFIKRDDGCNDVILTWDEGTLRIPYNEAKRKWMVPAEKSDGFWHSP